MSHDFTGASEKTRDMKSKIEQQKFLKGWTKKSFASLTNQRQVQVPAHLTQYPE